jgi:hypothetical protein
MLILCLVFVAMINVLHSKLKDKVYGCVFWTRFKDKISEENLMF